jgi:hypothetical protein
MNSFEVVLVKQRLGRLQILEIEGELGEDL